MANFFTLAFIAFVGIDIGFSHPTRFGSRHCNLHSKGAIASNAEGCAEIGQKVIEDGGSAADAAITLLLCEGIMLPQAAGIGGGFIAVIYNKTTGTVETLNAREWAPSNATRDMFENTTTVEGGIAVAVPGEIKGYYELHKKYGKLPWKRLFEPIIKMCRDGHKVMRILAGVMDNLERKIKSEPTMSDFINPVTNRVWREHDIMKRLKLADTLERIAELGADEFYNGQIAKDIVADVQQKGGILTEKDMSEYEVSWSTPTNISFLDDYRVYSIPTPGSGAGVSMILNMLENYKDSPNNNEFWYRVIESFKHAYGQRTNLGDMSFEESVEEVFNNMVSKDFAKKIYDKINATTSQNYADYGAIYDNFEDHGTLSLSVLHPCGDAISVTSTVNTNFGAKFCSSKTGILMNDEMDDFSLPGKKNFYGFPPSPANFIKPKKRPQSSMCPTIVVNKQGDAELVVGGAGGSKITSSVTLAIIRYYFLNENAFEAVNNKRLHHQLAPMEVRAEPGFPQSVIDSLKAKGHKVEMEGLAHGFNAVTCIGTRNGTEAVYDSRRSGSSTVFNATPKMIEGY